MLTSAIKLRPAFEKMSAEDKLYCEYFEEEEEKTKTKRIGPPTSTQWDEVERLLKFLKIFYKSTLVFSASTSVVSTLCYNEIVNIEKNLIGKCGHRTKEVRDQAFLMRDKFEKYWDGLLNMNELMIIGSVFDPRNKMQFADLCFEQLYGKNTIETRQLHASVTNAMKDLYAEYSIRLSKPDVTDGGGNQSGPRDSEQQSTICDLSDDEDDVMYEGADVIFHKQVRERSSVEGFSELDIYLAEKPELKVANLLGLPYDVLH